METSSTSLKKLCDIDNELERGVFIAAYNSSRQRRRRILAALVLGLKHALRGVLFSWPLYLLPLSTLALPGQYKYLFILFLLPGLYVSLWILSKGVKEDYSALIADRLLTQGYTRKLWLLYKSHRNSD